LLVAYRSSGLDQVMRANGDYTPCAEKKKPLIF